MSIALTSGQKVAVKIGAKVVIIAGTAAGATTVQYKILDNASKAIAETTAQAKQVAEATKIAMDEKLVAGEVDETTALATVAQAEAAIPSFKDIEKVQKDARIKAAFAGAAIASVGAAAMVGADILIDSFL